MLFKAVRAGDEVILATPTGRGAGSGFTYTLAEVEAVKSTTLVVDGFKFNVKDGNGRTTRHQVLPATPENRLAHLDEASEADDLPAAAPADDRAQAQAREALRIIRTEAGPDQDDDVIDLFGADVLANFRRQWRMLHARGR
ncbi:MAG TPA: hypothetical protein VM597_03110 [Gemmataceae bacterium]|jgi:hypothetical protein|nr:hypothetical protein [Gemmataceae bacterium]